MKKIPTLFKRQFRDHKVCAIYNEVNDGLEWVLKGEGIATLKFDGSCTAIINGAFYVRYDAKNGKKIPDNAIKCQEEADPITGHLPCWIPADRNNPSHKWHWTAYDNYLRHGYDIEDGTYEAIGPHFQGNPYNMTVDDLVKHGSIEIYDFPRDFKGIHDYLETHKIEGVVFWKDGEPKCKIKRSDFGFEWPTII